MMERHGGILAVALAPAITGSASAVRGQHTGHVPAPGGAGRPPVRISEEALHAGGGVPPGWRFTVPGGDPAAGRQVLVQFKCYACHAVKGEQFPPQPGEAATAGPDLTGMGSHHPAEYLAEAILNPSAVVVDAPGYAGGGRPIDHAHPSRHDPRAVAGRRAYVKSLTGGDGQHQHGGPLVRSVGPYQVRLAYQPPPEQSHDHQHQGHAAHAPTTAPGTLVAFVSAQATGQPMPHLTVAARIEGPKGAVRTVALAPTLGEEGFHYAARTALPEGVRRITLSPGRAAVKLAPGAPREVLQPYRVSFEWR